MTNGEALKGMYPNLKVIGYFTTKEKRIMVRFNDEDDNHDFALEWWEKEVISYDNDT